jgi:hypothetical protein
VDNQDKDTVCPCTGILLGHEQEGGFDPVYSVEDPEDTVLSEKQTHKHPACGSIDRTRPEQEDPGTGSGLLGTTG